jgi:hypothetical protein
MIVLSVLHPEANLLALRVVRAGLCCKFENVRIFRSCSENHGELIRLRIAHACPNDLQNTPKSCEVPKLGNVTRVANVVVKDNVHCKDLFPR